jgi:hypothetical protein
VLGKVVDAGVGTEGKPMVSAAGMRYQKGAPGR